MLIELTISNFAIIDALRVDFDPHLNIFTGETGAGKSIIVDAISALVGERVTADVVRAEAERAIVEGVFDLSALLPTPSGGPRRADEVAADHQDGEQEAGGQLADALAELGLAPEDGTLILAREILASGRGIARVNGRAVPVSALQRLGRFLVDIHGQGAHLELLRPEQHVFYLDRYAGTVELQRQVAGLVAEWRAARRELERLRRDERELERRVELLRYQVDEIEAAKLRPGEQEELETERRRLANAERLGELCAAIHAALAGDTDSDLTGAEDLLAGAQRELAELLRLDDTLREQAAALDQALYLLQDVSSGVRAYQDQVAADPARQAEVEERLDLLAKLRRKYGATTEDILAFAAEAARELDELTHREERAAALAEEEEHLRARIGALAAQLSARRREAAERLSGAMEHELDDLNMRRARFQVRIAQQPEPSGAPADLGSGAESYAFGPTGIDRVEFLIAPNPGEPFKPLARIASGGETSRLMLALKTILSSADIVPLLIFDEIDAGISGRSGQVVGEKLWQLARAHQILSVTHLAQIAALGDRHYRVTKAADEARTTTRVEALPRGERVSELTQMLGGARTEAALANAADLLSRADAWKKGHRRARADRYLPA
ncbi:MAG TPA: DNA repair protein RecN [Ktedonobacterales bacterium]|nr:DNA repair protein RecN [Ktedonobacterales bacterium]